MHHRLYQLLSLFLLSFCCKGAYAQWPGHYLNPTCKWFLVHGGGNAVGTYRGHYQYYINGDTTIGGNSFYKIYRQGVDSNWNSAGAFTTAVAYNEYASALRETPTQRFYAVYPGYTTEALLFSFDYNDIRAGLPTESNVSCNNVQPLLAPSDTVYLGSIPLRRYNVAGTVNRLIEGVGSEGGLLEHSNQCLFFDGSSTLICFSKDNNQLQVSPTIDCPQPRPAGSPDCEARYCYATNTDALGMLTVSFFNTSRLWVTNDAIQKYEFDFGDGTPIYTSNAPTQSWVHAYPLSGTIRPTLRLLTAGGCTSTYYTTLQAGNTCSLDPTGTVGMGGRSAYVLPTVVQSRARVVAPAGVRMLELRLYDAHGSLQRTLRLSPGAAWSRAGLSAGLYFYELHADGKPAGAGKLVLP